MLWSHMGFPPPVSSLVMRDLSTRSSHGNTTKRALRAHIRCPLLIGPIRMEVLLKQVGSHWYSFLTVRRDRAMFGALSGDAQFPHQASDTFLTTRNTLCLQFEPGIRGLSYTRRLFSKALSTFAARAASSRLC